MSKDLQIDTNDAPNLIEVVHTIRRSWILTIDELRELTGLADATTEELVAAVSSRIESGEEYPNSRTDEYFEGDEPEDFQDVTMERTARAYYHPSGDADPADFPGDDDCPLRHNRTSLSRRTVMSKSVQILTTVLYPQTVRNDDHGPWEAPNEGRAELEKWLARDYEIVSTAVTTLNTAWGHNLEPVTDTRLVLVTTLVEK